MRPRNGPPRRAGVLACPDDGAVFILTTADGRLYCNHQAHDGRPRSHPDGAAPQTRRTYTLDELTKEEDNRP